MYIKYQNNIHNIKRYYSVIKSSIKSIAKNDDSLINLVKDENNFMALKFADSDTRNFFLSRIWEEMTKGSAFYDIDTELEVYNSTTKYNL